MDETGGLPESYTPRSTRPMPKPLPSLESITTARRNIQSVAFRQYLLQRKMPEQEVKSFVAFLDFALENMGKGMAFVHWRYGAINPRISITDDQNFGAEDHSPQGGYFPAIKCDLFYSGKKQQVVERFFLTDHRDSHSTELFIPIKKIYDMFKDNNAFSHSLKGAAGKNESPVNLNNTFLAIGAHEGFHLYDMLYHRDEISSDRKDYKPADPDGYEAYYNQPLEQRARFAAREAMTYYNQAKTTSQQK